jgi:hypothetical protein
MTDNANAPDAASSSGPLPHIAYTPPPMSPRDIARRRRAEHRVERNNHLPSWLKKVSWIIFPTYGLMRFHDPNYEEHYEQYEERQRKDYGG